MSLQPTELPPVDVPQTEFLQEAQARMESARRSLDEARADGDDYLIQVRTGELESLERLIADNRGDDVLDLRERTGQTQLAC